MWNKPMKLLFPAPFAPISTFKLPGVKSVSERIDLNPCTERLSSLGMSLPDLQFFDFNHLFRQFGCIQNCFGIFATPTVFKILMRFGRNRFWNPFNRLSRQTLPLPLKVGTKAIFVNDQRLGSSDDLLGAQTRRRKIGNLSSCCAPASSVRNRFGAGKHSESVIEYGGGSSGFRLVKVFIPASGVRPSVPEWGLQTYVPFRATGRWLH